MITAVGCDSSSQTITTDEINVAERISIQENLSGLQSALESAGLLDTLRTDGPFTVFATTLSDVSPSAIANAGVLSSVLQYHVVPQNLPSDQLSDGQTLTTLSGDELDITTDGDGNPLVNGVPVTEADVPANNGVVHVIGGTLLENQSVATRVAVTNQTATLNAAAGAGGDGAPDLAQDGITVFAPVNGAFGEFVLSPDDNGLLADTDLLNSILNYHVVEQELAAGDLASQSYTTAEGSEIDVQVTDGGVFVNDARVVSANLRGTNGIVHLIAPQQGRSTEGVLTRAVMNTQQRLQYTEALRTLFGAAGKAGADLSSGGPFTVFAPTNEAFSGLDVGSGLTMGLAQKLVNYHVLPQELSATDLIEGGDAEYGTAQGSNLAVSVRRDGDGNPVGVNVDSLQVTTTDINTSNGVLHYVESAPLQTQLNITERAILTTPLATLVDAASATGRASVLEQDGPFTVFAPADGAFGALPEGVATDLFENETDLLGTVLDYHVIENARLDSVSIAERIEAADTLATTRQGQDVALGTADAALTVRSTTAEGALAVSVPDVVGSNGIVHIIGDGLLIPEVNVVETGVLNGYLSLRTATEVTDLRSTLESQDPLDPEPITLFAPSDAAFQAYLDQIGAPSLDRLTQEEEDQLAEVLQYHAVNEDLSAAEIQSNVENSMDGEFTVQTLQGEDLTFTLDGGTLLVNGNPIGPADFTATNGRVHGIETVLQIPSQQ
jgi:uncharacterized surface protein with fasciclin (FAS1) repeats